MFLDKMKQIPGNFNYIEKLIVDREGSTTQVVCLDLDKTLIYLSNKAPISTYQDFHFKEEWLDSGININLDANKETRNELVLIQRPGFAEFITELSAYAVPVIYSNLAEKHLRSVMHTLSSAYNPDDPEQETQLSRETTYACWRIPQWSRKQCIETNTGLKKSLGHFAKLNNIQINDLWLIDNRPDMVDFPSHVIQIPPFYGDPNDRVLFKLIDDIFNN